jgi:putative heme-binding domain-containing protein
MRIALLFLSCWSMLAQDHGVTPETIRRGANVYFSNCINCHGPDGDRVSGVNLASNRFRKAKTDQDLIDIVRKGIPGTPMPPASFSEEQAAAIVAYLHSMANSPRSVLSSETPPGDPARGQAIFESKGQCLSCHRVSGTESFVGPDLSGIGATRRNADLETSLLDPNSEIREENRTLRAVNRDGSAVTGILLNQDTYSLQILDPHGKLVSLHKANLREFEILKTSPMPSYRDKLTPEEIADVVSYLVTLKGNR